MGARAQGKVTSGSPNSWRKKCLPFVTLPENMKLGGMVLKKEVGLFFIVLKHGVLHVYTHTITCVLKKHFQ